MYIDGVGFIHDALLGGTRPMTRFEVLSQDKNKLARELENWADHMGYDTEFFLKWLDEKWTERDEKYCS